MKGIHWSLPMLDEEGFREVELCPCCGRGSGCDCRMEQFDYPYCYEHGESKSSVTFRDAGGQAPQNSWRAPEP